MIHACDVGQETKELLVQAVGTINDGGCLPTGGRLIHVICLSRFWDKVTGLLGASLDSPAVLIEDCRSIHTFGMKFPIDVAFMDGDGRVTKSLRALQPGRIASSHRACRVMERPASDDIWPSEGMLVYGQHGYARPQGILNQKGELL